MMQECHGKKNNVIQWQMKFTEISWKIPSSRAQLYIRYLKECYNFATKCCIFFPATVIMQRKITQLDKKLPGIWPLYKNFFSLL